ncbi:MULTISPECIES: FadR/GntR family transcriptional regulator [Colwelliaceae]|uniref:FadR family transcriptional regulator n=1 Tax=Cognaticolwellia beringensis TaxID=1967665 RepID=A0A222G9T8_9GAMM|nr:MULTISPECIES: FadR/GntR family transcriptional regulator [Colwelliaceae]ARD45181.1 GntR family transcriptional regulator [Colwellia sp. PAMC 21821]ASP48656.1 FadR family transcriptional regulator [Cognaticolwellia beringensis]
MGSNRRLFWGIVDKIEALIDSGIYSPGSRLPPERELAETFKVSRPTIREAIIALEVREKIEVKTGSGVYVLKPVNQLIGSNKQVNAFEVTQARALIEGEVAAIAATTITEDELARLHQTLVDMEKGEFIAEADKEFHQIIANATRNSAMILSAQNLWKLRSSTPEIIKDYDSVCSKDNSKTLAEHTAIYQALKSGDSTQARLAMHGHFNRLINALFDAVELRALEEIRQKNSETRGLYSIPNPVDI